jgi:hypothetical protein
VAYLESWGDATAESPAGPKGIMQFSEATARQNGLRIFRTTRYRTVTEKRQVKGKRGKIITRTVTRKVPYTVVSRDERFQPERAVPAAAMYLAQMERKFGGRDWAVFAYHCGEGCVSNIQAIFSQTNEYKQGERSVARMFFAANPAHNRELYETLRYHMERDYSPTYWFRIMRAQSLLALYKEDPETFAKLTMEYKYQSNPSLRAPHRLSVWLKPEDLMYQTCDDIRRDMGTKLARAVDNPEYFGFTLRKSGPGAIGEGDPGNADVYMQASPAALGTLMYIAYETRRLHEELHPKGEKFVPIEVTSLVRPKNASDKGEAPTHCSGQVFDISSQNLPPGERECLQFVLDDIGWNGYLGFVQEANDSNTLHVGCAPGAREFFSKVFEESSAPAKPSAE